MKKSLLLLAFTVTVSSALLSTQAVATTILMNDTFETYTTGTAPTTPGDGNDRSWTAIGDLGATVVEGSSTGGTAPNNKVLHLQGDANMEDRGAFSRDFDRLVGSAESADTFSISFKLMIDSFSNSDYRINLQDSTLEANNSFASLRIYANGTVSVLTRATGPGTGGATNATNPSNNRLMEDRWYEFTIDANLQAQTYSVTIVDLANPSKTWSTGDLFFYRDLRSLDQIHIHPVDATTTNTAMNWYLDDVRAVTSIPEPGAVISLLAGGLLIAGGLRIARKP